MRRILLVVMLAVVASIGGCGTGEPSLSPGDLFGEYARTTDVRHDRFPDGGGSSADRLANFASMGTPDQVAGALMRTFDCGDDSCEPSGSVDRAAADFAGADSPILGRSLLVKHRDGSLELVTVYVVQKPDGSARLIDGNGGTYTDLEDFRSHNDVLEHDDTVLTLRNVTSVPGEGALVVVSGHTARVWPWWLAGALAALVIAGAVILTIRRYRAARHPDPLLIPLEFKDRDDD
ncbi:hypothetical protein [Cryptosporangium phraense]|uniref:Lipoprotein n=1 Tax=Cryptosporangium phraense TaxID=2593070 RepID=A0A545AY27_9ACTN|nr:hypothetical protein [Cryptosporangium phraense]TQS46208.1 hypothetical protein FL583_06965 [Cryptosporangium phraense]